MNKIILIKLLIIIFSVRHIKALPEKEDESVQSSEIINDPEIVTGSTVTIITTTQQPLCPDCVYLGRSYPQGFIIGYECHSIICKKDGWEELPANPTCCSFEYTEYVDQFILEYGCFTFQCQSGLWRWTAINPNCPECFVSTDPNIYTFDGSTYRSYGKCNYTLVQPFLDGNIYYSYFPPNAIYGSFGDCGKTASCVDVTTFKVNKHTSIEINHSRLPVITINGNEVGAYSSLPEMLYDGYGKSFPVFVWSIYNPDDGHYCIVVAGKDYSIYACSTYLIIYTVPESLNYTTGLCGFYSNSPDDDFILRNQTGFNDHYNPVDMGPFVESWMTLEMDFNCACKDTSGVNPTNCDDQSVLHSVANTCEAIVLAATTNCFTTENIYSKFNVESCNSDCCTEFENCNYWFNQTQKFICTLGQLSRLK